MSAMSLHAGVKVDRIEPTNWYVGMKDASLKLMPRPSFTRIATEGSVVVIASSRASHSSGRMWRICAIKSSESFIISSVI